MAICEFCKRDIEPGTGKKFVYKDGKAISLCSSKCEKNLFQLRRKSRTTAWTLEYQKLKKSEKTPSVDRHKSAKKKVRAGAFA